ncbi:MAG TPA: secretin N-terminal domain-containing protein [Tepidiformaceae bacterium]|nr:secretin N-terminal domain-containing protein [Tepidiformaceae bacterium]
MTRLVLAVAACAIMPLGVCDAQSKPPDVSLHNDSVSVRFLDVDLRGAVDALTPYLDKPVVFGGNVPGVRVTLETPHPVARRDVFNLLVGLLASQNLELVRDSTLYRVQTKSSAAPPQPASTLSTGARPPGVVQLYVIHLRHARAADVAATVNTLYGRASSFGEIGANRPQTLDQQLSATQVPPAGTPKSPDAVAAIAGRPATLTGDVTIVPDSRSNSLLVRADADDFALIQAAVNELDTRPLQVLIEVIIAEVQRNTSLGYGIDATLPPTKIDGTSTVISGSQAGAGLTDIIVQAMHVTSLNIDATLTAAEERGDVKILSRPVVIAANNQPATINVGSQRPFVQVSRTLATDNTARDQVVEYKDVGTKLTVVPTISPDGYVGLDVTQEIDNATTEVAFDAPVISTRSVQTQLLLKDGQTVALGGLTDSQHEVSQGGIPFLSRIPVLGGLFGHASRQSTEDQIYLFLTPHVIRTDQDADSLTQPMLKRADKDKP